MHPILESRQRLVVYLLQWLPAAALLGYLFVFTGNLSWQEALALVVPLAAFYAFVCLSPWYLCRALPLSAPVGKLLGNHVGAAATASLLWIVLAKGLVLVLSRYFPRLDERFSRLIPVLFGIGVVYYLLAVALHYVLISVDASREAIAREQEARVLAREAELKALKAQINPHFLFNSLNSISALAIVDGARARDMCIGLADFLRATLRLGESPAIPFTGELALSLAYLNVEQFRFGPRLRVDLDIGDGCEHCLVPSLLLQPIVENAVKHGIAGLLEGGTVVLRASRKNARLRLEVENEFDPDAPAPPASGLGLANVRARLQARYGGAARLETRRTENRYCVEVSLPCEDSGAML